MDQKSGVLRVERPWNIASFTEKLLLKKGCQKPLGQGQRSVHLGSQLRAGPWTLTFPKGCRPERSRAAACQRVSLRHTFCNHSPQRRKRTTLRLGNGQGVTTTKPPPSFLGKCKASCGLFTDLREDEMSAVTEFSVASSHLPHHLTIIYNDILDINTLHLNISPRSDITLQTAEFYSCFAGKQRFLTFSREKVCSQMSPQPHLQGLSTSLASRNANYTCHYYIHTLLVFK